MLILVGKTEVIHVHDQDTVSKTTNTEAKRSCNHKCRNTGCNRVFFNYHGTRCHEYKYRFFLVEKLWALADLKAKGNS